jgi:hypothetical protein
MTCWRTLLPAVLTSALLLAAAPAGAATTDPCELLFVPEEYELGCVARRGADPEDWRLVVRPEAGAFAPLSELSVEPVEEPIDDRDAWLRDQLSFDLRGFEDAFRNFADSDDSPITDEQFTDSLEAWLGAMASLAEMPLEGCAEPSTAPGNAREMTCEWRLGPFRQYLLTRLVERDDRVYAIRIRAMNERRLRHLVAIANSF